MIKGRKIITIEAVLDKITEYDIFRMYMPGDWKVNKAALSPFRHERTPSFVISSKKGYLSFIDFGDTSFRGDCFEFVKKMFNLPYLEDVLRKIDNDFGLGFNSERKDYESMVRQYKQPEVSKRSVLIQVVTRKFTKQELVYWAGYHQSIDDLRANNVYSIRTLYMNRQRFTATDNELRFGYLYDGHWKIYSPFADRRLKWMPNNVPITAMDGMDDVKHCSIALITKSKKDYMVMKKVFPHCCAVQNEGIGCFSEENVQFLKDNSDVQFLSFDNDITGVTNSQKITKLFDFQYINVPRRYIEEGIKDWADLAKHHGLKTIEAILKKKRLL